jgi:polygalacturonase
MKSEDMKSEDMKSVERREFLKLAGIGLAVTGLYSLRSGPAQARQAGGVNVRGAFDVRDFGAAGDGKKLDTAAVNKAITAAVSGGGTVRFPPGTYLCHSIHLKSRVSLFLAQGATILAADSPENPGSPAYDLAEPNQWDQFQDFGHSHWHNSLLWGEGISDIDISGPGIIWGKGLSRGYGEGPKAEQPGVANKAISLKNCHNVLLRDISILEGGHFAVLASGVDNLTLDNLKIDTNRDGMDIDCCRNVRVSNCSVNSPWDDGICLKSSYGLGAARATEDVTITNCFVSGDYQMGTLLDGSFKHFAPDFQVPRTGRIKFGTESNGGFKNITVSNCVFDTCRGIALESVDGALLEDVTITNVTMRDITSAPIFMRLGSRMRGPSGIPVGQLRRVILSNLVCSNSASSFGCVLSGIPSHEIENVKLSDISIQYRGGGTKDDAAIELPEKENGYPEPSMFGTTPAYGFYVRHVRGLEMANVEVETMRPDARPAFMLSDVREADFARIRAPHTPDVAVFSLNNVEDFSLQQSTMGRDIHLDRVAREKF